MKRTYDDSMFIDTFEHEYTWINGVMRNVHRYGLRPAVIDPETNRQWNYRELNEEANRLAHALQEDGIKKNDVVMSALRNCPEFAFAYTGPRKIGAILLAANYNLAAGEMALLINHNKPRTIIYSANVRDMIVQAAAMCAWKPERFVMADNREGVSLLEGHTSYEAFTKGKAVSEPVRKGRPHIYDEVLRLCTSGTTALPKSVPLNDINEVLSAHDVIMQYPLGIHDVTLNMTPWFHRGGCHCGGPCPAFYAGSAVIIMRRFQPQNALEWVSRYGVTFMMGTPANLDMLSRVQAQKPKDLSRLKGIVTMGAPLSKNDCIRFMETLTPNIFNGYGTTETFWNSFLRPYNLPDGAGSVGASCIDDEVRVVRLYNGKKADPDDMVAHDNLTEGEIIIRAPGKTTCAYYHNDEMTREKFYKGWMYTGDIGTWDTDENVTVCGRKDDMIVVSGENIYPAQIEEAICEHQKVRDCLVTAVPDKVRGQAVAAYVVADDKSLTIRELFDFCTSNVLLSRYKCPRYFAIIDELPATATGKKLRNIIKARAKEDVANGTLKRSK